MKPAPFEYHAPESLGDVTALLAEYGDEAKVLAGGQSLVPMLALRLTRFEHLVDLNRVDELPGRRALERHAHGRGHDPPGRRSSTTPPPARRCPLLAQAIPLIGHFQIRNRGTVGGSIAHADPASELPAVALALDAELEVAGPNGTRRGPGRRVLPRHLDHRASRPTRSSPRCTSRCGRAAAASRSRRSPAAAATSRSPASSPRSSSTTAARSTRSAIALPRHGAHAGAGPHRRGRAQRQPSPERARPRRRSARLAVADTDPTADVHASAEYRQHVGAHLVERALDRALGAARRG